MNANLSLSYNDGCITQNFIREVESLRKETYHMIRAYTIVRIGYIVYVGLLLLHLMLGIDVHIFFLSGRPLLYIPSPLKVIFHPN